MYALHSEVRAILGYAVLSILRVTLGYALLSVGRCMKGIELILYFSKWVTFGNYRERVGTYGGSRDRRQ